MAITQEEISTIKRFRKMGKSVREIKRLTGRNRGTICKAINCARKKLKKEKIWDTMRHSRKFTYSDIQRLTGCSRGYIINVSREYQKEGLIYKIGKKQHEYVWAVKPHKIKTSKRDTTAGYLPCPFCGSKINILKDCIYCDVCDTKFILNTTHDHDQKKKWNKRK